jgi:O-antigen/teichoic acid export membrane protein
MGTYVTMLIGVAAAVAGAYGIAATWPLAWLVLKACGLLVLVIGGVLAVVVGLGELQDRRATRARSR